MRLFNFVMQPEGIVILGLVALICMMVFAIIRSGKVRLVRGGTEVKVKSRKKAKR